MADNGAENTGDVTTSKRNCGLSTLAVVALLTGKLFVDDLDSFFERGKFHHLKVPLVFHLQLRSQVALRCTEFVDPTKGRDPCTSYKAVSVAETARYRGRIIPCRSFLSSDDRDSVQGAGGERRDGSLHADLDSLEWAKGNVRKKLGRGTSSKIEPSPVPVGIFLSYEVGVLFLEEFVAAVLESTLELGAVRMLRSNQLM